MMKTITVRQVPERIHEITRLRAASKGRSMEEEVRWLMEREALPRRSPAEVAADLQKLAKSANKGRMPKGVVDELLAERRREAEREDAE